MKTFRLIRSSPAGAAYNMALDEKIFHRYIEDGKPAFRVYGWQVPSFTYGVSQKPQAEINLAQCVHDGIQIAQRMTGGGVLFHHNEITYSLVCAKEDIGEDKDVFVSYQQICAFLISFYESLGLKASFALEAEGFKDKSRAHPLCSASREKYDIVINAKKIGGNAQKRKREAIFQHGSIPLSIDWELMRRYVRFLPEEAILGSTTLTEEIGNIPDKKILEEKLIDVVARVFNVNFIEEEEPLYETYMA
jgi:lipoate-protein ligase A